MAKTDKDVETYRNLITVPEKFEDGFGWGTIVGALFLGLIVTPGSIFISLVAGESVGPAARWVTILLFAEVAKRSLKEMSQQQVFVIYYMTAHVIINRAEETGLLFNLFLAQNSTAQAMGIASQLPNWVVPEAVRAGVEVHSFLTFEWLPAVALIVTSFLLMRLDNFGLGYILWRITSDVEKLPFPMAAIEASGVISLAETKDKSERWRPACFSIGGIIGLIFGAIYLGIPALTGIFFVKPAMLLPLPWIELTESIKGVIPATAFNFAPSLGFVIIGMVLPFWAVLGGFLGVLITFILNPILYTQGVLHSWRPGMKTVDTLFANSIDFYLSFGLGITFFIAAIGIVQALVPLIKSWLTSTSSKKVVKDQSTYDWSKFFNKNRNRADISIWTALGIYILSTCTYIGVTYAIVDGFEADLFIFFFIYGFIYTPIIGYAAARIEGLAGQSLSIPYIKESAFIMSGYKGVAIWFAPIPNYNYSSTVNSLRVVELTGTRLTSIIKTDLITLPIIITSLVVFSSLIISLGPLDSPQYPYVQEVWDLSARNRCLIISSTLEGKQSMFFDALNFKTVAVGFLGGGMIYAVLSFFSLPIMLIFGVVRGLGQTNPLHLLPEMIGALLGRYYFEKKFGPMWKKYTPSIFAGFTCGMGLIGIACVSFRLIATCITPAPY